MIDTNDTCTKCGQLTIYGDDPAWYYNKNNELKLTFIDHKNNCEGAQ